MGDRSVTAQTSLTGVEEEEEEPVAMAPPPGTLLFPSCAGNTHSQTM